MKPALTALCMLALTPVATLALDNPAAENSPQVQCLQKFLDARSADDAHQARMNMLITQRLGATGSHSVGGSANWYATSSLIHRRVAASVCDARPEAQQDAASRSSESHRARASRGVNWKVGPR